MDKGQVTSNVLLNLSATFDTVNIYILTNILTNFFYITGTCIQWFKSYLTDRTQQKT